MAKIRIVGDSSGYVELAAPNAAGNNTLELPSNATKLVGADASNSLNVTGIATFSGGIVGNVTGNVNATGLSTFTSGINVGTGTSISSPATNVLTLGTNNVERVRVSAAGSFGFNTTSPQSLIDIGAGSASAPTYKGTIRIQPNDAQSTNSNGGIEFLSSSFSNGYGYRLTNPDLGGGSTPFIIESRSNSATWTERVRIDSSGRVTMPYQPYARASCSSFVSATNAISLNEYNLSRGGITISGSRFTVPVAGAYVIGYHHLGNSGSGACQVEIRVNNTYISGTKTQDTNSSNDSFGTQTVRELSASDYVEFFVVQGTTHNNRDYNSMWIWLLG